MLLHDDSIVSTLTKAFESGMNVPKTFFKEEDTAGLENIHRKSPLWIQKPDGIEFTYMIYWTGKKFRGGYVSINNNYQGVQRGKFQRNGETLFCSHIPEIKRCYKKILPEKGWIAYSFIMDENGKIFFWGRDNIEHYKLSIEYITGVMFDELEDLFDTDGKLRKPIGYVASTMIFDESNKPSYIESSFVDISITKVWKNFYDKINSEVPKQFNFTIGLEQYMRRAYALLQTYNKLY